MYGCLVFLGSPPSPHPTLLPLLQHPTTKGRQAGSKEILATGGDLEAEDLYANSRQLSTKADVREAI